MRQSLIGVLLLILSFSVFAKGSVAQGAPKAPVQVDYIQPEKFTDISSTNYGPPNPNYLDQLRKHLEKKAATYLESGQQLTVSITDVDMAGGFEPWVMPINPDVRMVRDIYPPRIVLSYTLLDADGKVLKEGDERLTNPAYLLNSRPNTLDTMRHEKALLDSWLIKLFAAHKNG